MSVIGSNSVAAQVYGVTQGRQQKPEAQAKSSNAASADSASSFRLPSSSTPRGDWVLSENANPQNFEAGAPRGTYLNVVV